MKRILPAALTAALLPLTPAPAAAEMMRPWSFESLGDGGPVWLKSCSGEIEVTADGTTAFAPCIDVACDPAVGLMLTVVLLHDAPPQDWPATVYAEVRDKGRFTFTNRPESLMYPSALLQADEMRALLDDLAGSAAMSVLFRDPPFKDMKALRGYPMDGASEAIPAFLAACPLLNAAAPALPSFVVPEDGASTQPELPSFTIVDDGAGPVQPPAQPPGSGVRPGAGGAGAGGTAVLDPAALPDGMVPGMPLAFLPDPFAAPLTPADDATRFVTIKLAAIPDTTAETLAQALMAPQQVDFAARYGGVPVISGDLVVFNDGRLILSAVFCVDGKTGDQGCETWTMTTVGGGEPFVASSRGLPSERPLWVDLRGQGKGGWPDLLVQDAAGVWTRLAWNGTGYF